MLVNVMTVQRYMQVTTMVRAFRGPGHPIYSYCTPPWHCVITQNPVSDSSDLRPRLFTRRQTRGGGVGRTLLSVVTVSEFRDTDKSLATAECEFTDYRKFWNARAQQEKPLEPLKWVITASTGPARSYSFSGINHDKRDSNAWHWYY